MACVAGPGQAESREEDAIAAAAVQCAVAMATKSEWVGFLGWRQLGLEQKHRGRESRPRNPWDGLDTNYKY